MARYRIVCTEQQPYGHPPASAKIVAVGISAGEDRATHRWTVPEVVRAIDGGTTFFTRGLSSGRTAEVEKYWCSQCSSYHIRSSRDAVTDNNLDSLRLCTW